MPKSFLAGRKYRKVGRRINSIVWNSKSNKNEEIVVDRTFLPSPNNKTNEICDSYDEVNGDISKLRTVRKLHLPLFKNNETNNDKTDNLKDIQRRNDVTLPSVRVSRTINFDSVTSSQHELETRSLQFTTLCYELSKPLSMSPIVSFPFRQDELASPDSPLSSTIVANVPDTRQNVQHNPHTGFKNETNSKLKDNYSKIQKSSESVNYNYKINTDVDKSEKIICEISMPNKYYTNRGRVYSERSPIKTMDENAVVKTEEGTRKYYENISNTFDRLECPQTSFILPIKTRQDISHYKSRTLPNIWRPIPLMAASTQETVASPLGMKLTDNQNHPSDTKHHNSVNILPIGQANKPVSLFQSPMVEKVELVNGGNGIKNPLLSQTEFKHGLLGVRPYKCGICGKSFTQRCSLESHCKKVHGSEYKYEYKERRTKLYVCEDCGHTTIEPGEHFVHLKSYHPQSPVLLRFYDKRQFKFSNNESLVSEQAIC